MANNAKQIVTDVKTEILSIVDSIKIVEQQVLESSRKMRESMKNLVAPTSPSGMNDNFKKQQTDIENLNKKLTELTEKYDNLKSKKQQLSNQTAIEIANQKELKKRVTLQGQATSAMVGAYANLISKQKQAKRVLQDEISKRKQNVNEIKKAQRAYDRLTAKVNKANKATSNFSKTGLGGAVRGFRNLIGAFGIIGGATMFASMAKNVFNLTKKLQSLGFTLEKITEGQKELMQTQSFLEDISNKYGLSIITTTERYTKFLAAAKQSNVSLEDTEQIFRSVSKAAGVLGLKTDELSGVYLALEQMLSKGKVTTEELRRQLGERLPGAFGIMADAIGVNTRELDKMLRKGEIL